MDLFPMKQIVVFFALVLFPFFGYSQGARNVYFPVDSFHLSNENVVLISDAISGMGPGDKIVFRVLIHDDAKNRPAINELDRKRSLELFDFFVAEGFPAGNIKVVKTPGREAKGFISDDMKNLLIYDLEVYKALPAVDFTVTDSPVLSDSANETYSFSAGVASTFKGNKGIEISIPAFSFEFKTGAPASGSVLLEVKEYLHPGEMAAAGLMTMNEEFPAHCGAIVWMRATSGGTELRLKKGKQLTLKLPSGLAPADPKLYIGQEGNGLVRWFPYDPAMAGQVDAGGTCSLSTPLLHWIACEGIDKKPDNGVLTVKTNVSYNVAIRLILKDEKTVMGAYMLPGTKDLGFSHIPVGKKAVLVAYGVKDGKMFFFSKEVVTQNDWKEKIQMKESTTEAIKTFLTGLDK